MTQDSEVQRNLSLCAIEYSFQQVLKTFGTKNFSKEVLEKTPMRMAKMYYDELCAGLTTPQPKITTFPSVSKNPVVMSDIKFSSLCAHHFLPFFGSCDFAYTPNKKIVGLSKIPRLLNWHAKRPTIQEELGEAFVAAFAREVKPIAVVCLIRAEHLCVSIRGAKSYAALTTTRHIYGPPHVTKALGEHLKDSMLLDKGNRII